MRGISFEKINSFSSYISQYWSFLIFGDLRVEFLFSSFSYKNTFSLLCFGLKMESSSHHGLGLAKSMGKSIVDSTA